MLTAFISGLNNSAVSRLKWTLKKVPTRYINTLNELENLMSMDGAFKNYRNILQTTKPPLVPYLGVALQDLTFGK